jgi:hypothetical protein
MEALEMTTKVHIVNFGPQAVIVTRTSLQTGEDLKFQEPPIYPQQSVDVYVHDSQNIVISEKKSG